MAKYIKVYEIGGFSQTPNAQTASQTKGRDCCMAKSTF